MKKKVIWLVLTMLVALIVVGGCAQPAAVTTTVTAPAKTVTTTVTAAAEKPEVIEWTMSCHSSDAPNFGYWGNPGVVYNRMLHSLMDRGFATWVNDRSDGRLKITTVEPNSIFPTGETVENVGQGAIEASFVSQNWLAGVLPECYMAGNLPYGIPDAVSAFDLYFDYGYNDIMSEVYAEQNLAFVPVPLAEVAGLICSFDCPTPDDLAGKNMRVWGPMGKTMEALGANGVSVAFADQYMAMKLGTIDGACTSALSLENAKLKEVATGMVTTPKLYTAVDALLMNMDALDALPQDLQKLMMDSSREYYIAASGIEGMQQKYVVAQAKLEFGLQEFVWSDEDSKTVRKLIIDEVWPFYGAMSARNQELLDLKIDYMKTHGLID